MFIQTKKLHRIIDGTHREFSELCNIFRQKFDTVFGANDWRIEAVQLNTSTQIIGIAGMLKDNIDACSYDSGTKLDDVRSLR